MSRRSDKGGVVRN